MTGILHAEEAAGTIGGGLVEAICHDSLIGPVRVMDSVLALDYEGAGAAFPFNSQTRIQQAGRHRAHRRCHETARAIKPEWAFLDVPAVVAAFGDKIDLFDSALADIGEVQLTRLAVETECERIAKAVGENLIEAIGPDERIIARNAILSVRGAPAVDIDPDQRSPDVA